MKTALSIGGSDPTSGAGIQADLKVFHSLGVYGLTVITAITSQNTTGVKDISPLSQEVVKSQLYTLKEDIKIEAVKTGMLYSVDIVDVVCDFIKDADISKVVVDPVYVSSSGLVLTDKGALERAVKRLLPLTKVVTPNIKEASLISGIKIESLDTLYEAAKKIKSFGVDVVIITGGHFYEKGSSDTTVDFYYDGNLFQKIESQRYRGEYHGTGCVFSSAIAAYLCYYDSVLEATKKAKDFMDKTIQKAFSPGKGMGILGV
jgi:hydroxymethylpyrimidine/phosphomethylpyrimidine kinase